MAIDTWTLPGLTLTDLTVRVPLHHPSLGGPDGGPQINVFARVVTRRGGEKLPYLVFLQGGPGSEAPRPAAGGTDPAWLGRVLEDYQVVMLDQRGTGRSTPVGLDLPLSEGAIPAADGPAPTTLREASPAQQAEYLTRFRADAIVEDAEAVRDALGLESWTVLGQSFGGFAALRYLSAHDEALDAALFTGGLPAVGTPLENVYAQTWQNMIGRSEEHYSLFPTDRERFHGLLERADAGELLLPDGTAVSAARLRTLGLQLGASGGHEKLHYLLDQHPASPAFGHDLAAALPFGGRNPIYAVLHESCWADGFTTYWAADRSMPDRVREDRTLLAGEHVPAALFSEDPQLQPWAEVAELLAGEPWGALYDPAALAEAHVPAAAAVYYHDVYVPREHSLRTAALLPRMTPWITSEFEHNGLRASGSTVIDHLLGIVQGTRRA